MQTKENELLYRLKDANFRRCEKFGIKLEDWTPSDWATGLAGEVGELCNMITKRRKGIEIETEAMEKEVGDIIIYLDLLCQRLNIDLYDAIVLKFNEVSDRVGFDFTLT